MGVSEEGAARERSLIDHAVAASTKMARKTIISHLRLGSCRREDLPEARLDSLLKKGIQECHRFCELLDKHRSLAKRFLVLEKLLQPYAKSYFSQQDGTGDDIYATMRGKYGECIDRLRASIVTDEQACGRLESLPLKRWMGIVGESGISGHHSIRDLMEYWGKQGICKNIPHEYLVRNVWQAMTYDMVELQTLCGFSDREGQLRHIFLSLRQTAKEIAPYYQKYPIKTIHAQMSAINANSRHKEMLLGMIQNRLGTLVKLA